MSEDTALHSSVLLRLEWLGLRQPFADDVRPRKRQREQCDQPREPLRVGDMRLFHPKATRLQAAEQSLDLPSHRILSNHLGTLMGSDDYQQVTSRKPYPRNIDITPPQPARPGQRNRVPYRSVREQPSGRGLLAAPCRQSRVGSHADAKINLLSDQIREPFFADKLAVGAQIPDRLDPEQSEELVCERDPLRSIRAAFLLQDMPQHGKGRAFVRDPQDHHVDGRVAKVPVCSVERQNPGRGRCDQTRDEESYLFIGQFKEPEESLNPLIVRLRLGASRENISEFREVDGSDFDERDEKLCQEVDARTIPRYILSQHSLQRRRVSHRYFPSFPDSFAVNLGKDRSTMAFMHL